MQSEVQVRQNTLSTREQQVKERLFGNNQVKPTNQKPQAQPSRQPEPQIQPITQLQTNQIPKESVDRFLKDMEKDFKAISQKQVTMGMMNDQQQILKQHTEILNQNQQHLASMVGRPRDDSGDSLTLMRQLLQPINEQLRELKQQYDSTQRVSNVIMENLRQGRPAPEEHVHRYAEQSTNLKGLMETVDHNLKFLQPENLQTLQNFSNFNLQIYQDTISNLQRQIQVLQQQQEAAENDLNQKYKQLNDTKLKQRISLHKEQENELLADLTTQIARIDHNVVMKQVHEKLGGEFDYDLFMAEMNSYTLQAADIMESYLQEVVDIHVPPFKVDPKELQALSVKPTSILDELKKQMGIKQWPPKQQYVVTEVQQQLPPEPPYRPQPKVTTPKKYIEQPKVTTPKKYQPPEQPRVYERPPPTSDKKKHPASKEKLVYRKTKIPPPKPQQPRAVEPPKQSVALPDDNEPVWEISLPPQTVKQHQPQPTRTPQQEVTPKPISIPFELPSKEQIQHEPLIQDHLNYEQYLRGRDQSDNFVNYDQMMSDLALGHPYHPQEPKPDEHLIQTITRDVMRDKLQRMLMEKQRPQQPSEERVRTNKSTSTHEVPMTVQPPLQEQAVQGANAILSGIVQAWNNTLVQLNQGIHAQVQQLLPLNQQQKDEDDLDSSQYSMSDVSKESRVFRQEQRVPVVRTMLGPQQYTFAQDFNPKQVSSVNLKDYFRQFEADSESISNHSANRSNPSIFKLSDGEVRVSGSPTPPLIGKSTFNQIYEDISDGEVVTAPSKIF